MSCYVNGIVGGFDSSVNQKIQIKFYGNIAVRDHKKLPTTTTLPQKNLSAPSLQTYHIKILKRLGYFSRFQINSGSNLPYKRKKIANLLLCSQPGNKASHFSYFLVILL